MELLANPAWHALTGPQAPVAEANGPAVRFDPALSVFGALPDEATPAAWEAMAELVGPGSLALLIRQQIDPPDGWTELFGGVGVQMAWAGPAARRGIGAGSAPTGFDVVRLTGGDV